MVIGRLGRPHGVGGAVHARPTGPTLATLAPGDHVAARARGGAPRDLVVAEKFGTRDHPVLRFEGVADRDAAAALTGHDVLVPAPALPDVPDPDTFYVRDLVGCAVLAGDRRLGVVRDVHSAPANDALEVDGPAGRVLIPFTADALVALDVPGRRIVVREDLVDEAGEGP